MMKAHHSITWRGGGNGIHHHVCPSSSKSTPVSRTVVVVSAAPRERNISTTADVAIGKRGLAAATFLTFSIFTAEVDSRTELLQKYLKKSEENKAKYDKERQDSYYKRNYKDYFDSIQGSTRDKKEEELSETEKAILAWLEKNK